MFPKIYFHYEHPPIPRRDWDWIAYFDGREEEGPYGAGKTKDAALADLLQNWNDFYAA